MRKLFILMFCVLFCNIYAKRVFVWLPDLNDEQAYSLIAEYNKIITKYDGIVLNYSSNKTIDNISSELYKDKLKCLEKDNTFVIIGFGVGGIIARNLSTYSKNIEAIITISSPNAGSTLLHNVYAGKTYDFFSYASGMCLKAIEQAILSHQQNYESTNNLFNLIEVSANKFRKISINDYLKSNSSLIQSEIYKYLRNNLCVHNILKGSNFLNKLNNRIDSVFHYNIYGVKDNIHSSKLIHSLALINQIQVAHQFIFNSINFSDIDYQEWCFNREKSYNSLKEWDKIYQYLEAGIDVDIATSIGAIEYKIMELNISCWSAKLQYKRYLSYFPFITDNDGFCSEIDIISNTPNQKCTYNIRFPVLNHFNMYSNDALKIFLDRLILENFINLR
ncbi:MAG: hypothetical protein BGO29_08225 [Bacteroidales bacterium 36-12]|nr:MAG: hypothetical protein BGO29_08225 [Bacteroidales bacterium 36-12]